MGIRCRGAGGVAAHPENLTAVQHWCTLSNPMATDSVRIATRESRLALAQTGLVADALRARHPGLAVELVPMTTKGDRVLDRPLAQVGGKGLFVKELEVALDAGR